MSKVGIVTDSTCDLTLEEVAALDVEMVPLKVLFAEQSYLDWIELQPTEFYEKLKNASALPKTSQPSPADFTAAYQKLADAGCDAIVSIHLTSALSGTHASATMAAETAPVPIHIVDTKKVSQAVALVVKAAVEARAAGMDAEGIAKRAEEVSAAMKMYFILDTLEYLVKGGRAGKAQGLAASLLNIKPVLEMNADGTIEPFKKVKGRKKAVAELANHIAEEAHTKGRLKLALFNACCDTGAEELRAAIEATGADVEIESSGVVGSVIGTYAGPDALGCAYYPIG